MSFFLPAAARGDDCSVDVRRHFPATFDISINSSKIPQNLLHPKSFQLLESPVEPRRQRQSRRLSELTSFNRKLEPKLKSSRMKLSSAEFHCAEFNIHRKKTKTPAETGFPNWNQNVHKFTAVCSISTDMKKQTRTETEILKYELRNSQKNSEK